MENKYKAKAKELTAQMTREEKAAFLSGAGEWNTRAFKRLSIPEMIMSDGPHGIRRQAEGGDHLGLGGSLPATCFPTAATMASSWDEALGEEVGQALGEEAMAQGVNILLGPGMNIKRSPLCGRNFEYFSEDPYLAGKMAASYVRGIQGKGVYSCIKHFAVNSQEDRRMAMDAVIDERTLREIYLTGFEIAVKEGGAKSIMTSYNMVNGVYANENEHLLKDILRGKKENDGWEFDGVVITDWGGSNNHVAGVKAGSDLEMPAPGLGSARLLLKAVQSGELTEAEIDERCEELLSAVLETVHAARRGQKDGVAGTAASPAKWDQEGHHALAKKAASQCAVLLKNEAAVTAQSAASSVAGVQADAEAASRTDAGTKAADCILPLASGTKVAVIGDFAFTPRYQGAGSSVVNATKVESIAELIDQEPSLQVVGKAHGYLRGGSAARKAAGGVTDEALAQEALKAAEGADVILYFFGLDEVSESEGVDRKHMKLPQVQTSLLEKLHEVNPNIVGVISAGSAVEMPWEDNLKAILHAYLTGQAGASAILDILTGRVNPSGKLSESYPMSYEDTPAYSYYPAKERTSEYRESVYVGYRYYDSAEVPVRYPFGYGLSYTQFEYSDLLVTESGVSFKLKNTGSVAGAEVCQLYISRHAEEGADASAVFLPRKELKGFKKVCLEAGESVKVEIPFDDYSFRYWDSAREAWAVEDGNYAILVGSSSQDIRLRGSVSVSGAADSNAAGGAATGASRDTSTEIDAKAGAQETAAASETANMESAARAQLPSYFAADIRDVSDEEYEKLLGHAIPDGSWTSQLSENDAICQMVNAKNPIARFAAGVLENKKKKADEKGEPDLNVLFIYNMPPRAIAKMTQGAVSMDMADGIVEAANGHFFKGMKKVIGGYFKNSRENKEYEKKLSQSE